VKPDYPRAPPIFSLQIHWNQDMDAKNNTSIRVILVSIVVFSMVKISILGHGERS